MYVCADGVASKLELSSQFQTELPPPSAEVLVKVSIPVIIPRGRYYHSSYLDG